jgi:predicted N-acetyltransferase YhbS
MRFGNKPISRPTLAKGYALREVRPDDESDCQSLADLLNAAFKRTCHTAGEYAAFAVNSPSYRSDLELVAEAPDGSIAALVGMIYDEINRYGLFEPVATHPNHLRKGLASALMFEGLHRVKALGATHAYVETGDQVATNKLYEYVGFPETYRGYVWRKII